MMAAETTDAGRYRYELTVDVPHEHAAVALELAREQLAKQIAELEPDAAYELTVH